MRIINCYKKRIEALENMVSPVEKINFCIQFVDVDKSVVRRLDFFNKNSSEKVEKIICI